MTKLVTRGKNFMLIDYEENKYAMFRSCILKAIAEPLKHEIDIKRDLFFQGWVEVNVDNLDVTMKQILEADNPQKAARKLFPEYFI